MGQIARAVDRKLLSQVNLHLDGLLPDEARETGRDITVFRNAAGLEVFVAITSLDWVSTRGKRGRLCERAVGRGPDAPNLAVTALLAKLADPARVGRESTAPSVLKGRDAPKPKPEPKRESKLRSKSKAVPLAAVRTRPIDRGLVTAARRLLGYLVPSGSTKVQRSVTVAKRSEASRFFDATATAKWITAAGRPGSVTATASGDGPDPRNVALAYLLAKLERAPIGAQKKKQSANRSSQEKKRPAKRRIKP